MTLTSGQIILALFGAMGIPSALTGLFFWLLQRKIEKRDKEREGEEQARERLELLNIRATMASITLAEATARAVERIPDAHCNGDMHGALEYATGVKHDVRDFLATQATKAVIK